MPLRRLAVGEKMLAFPMIDNPNSYELAAARRYGMPLAFRRSGQILKGYAWFGTLYVIDATHENKDGEPSLPTGTAIYQPN
jgi:hypothetical protein